MKIDSTGTSGSTVTFNLSDGSVKVTVQLTEQEAVTLVGGLLLDLAMMNPRWTSTFETMREERRTVQRMDLHMDASRD